MGSNNIKRPNIPIRRSHSCLYGVSFFKCCITNPSKVKERDWGELLALITIPWVGPGI